MSIKETAKTLISVIVPIYNVEKYIRECLDSLKDQSMKQIEVICIDDGSTDNSGRIADEYQNDDGWPRFKVIHTENKGLSAVRNRGIVEAESDWIMFVDSDDWVSKDFCEIPYKAAIEHNADIVIFDRYLANECGTIKIEKHKSIPKGEIDFETAIDSGWPAVWNKLYSKDLFEDMKYPEGYIYEDLYLTHKILYKATKIVILNDHLYCYRRRKGSITQNNDNLHALLIASENRYLELLECGYPVEKAKEQLFLVALRCCGRAENGGSVYSNASTILKGANEIPAGFSFRWKVMFVIWHISKGLFRMVYKASATKGKQGIVT